MNNDYWEYEHLEDELHEQNIRDKKQNKIKKHTLEEWSKVEDKIQKKGHKKYVKNKFKVITQSNWRGVSEFKDND